MLLKVALSQSPQVQQNLCLEKAVNQFRSTALSAVSPVTDLIKLQNLSDRRVRLYIVHDVPENTVFYPKVRGEIANFCWFRIDELPGSQGFKKKSESFFMVNQFIRWVGTGYFNILFGAYFVQPLAIEIVYFHYENWLAIS